MLQLLQLQCAVRSEQYVLIEKFFKIIFLSGRNIPFRVGVNFDGYEYQTSMTADMAQLNEEILIPAGIIGFKLTYWQVPC